MLLQNYVTGTAAFEGSGWEGLGQVEQTPTNYKKYAGTRPTHPYF